MLIPELIQFQQVSFLDTVHHDFGLLSFAQVLELIGAWVNEVVSHLMTQILFLAATCKLPVVDFLYNTFESQ